MATATRTATPGAGLWITEICTNPGVDSNLDGSVNADDSYVKLWNGYPAGYNIRGWRLAFAVGATGNICSTTDPNNTFVFRRFTYLYPKRGKVVYQSDLINMVGNEFALPPAGSAASVALCDETGATQSRVDYYAANGHCVYIPR